MTIGVEIDMIVQDSLEALETYRRIFDIEPVEATAFSKGNNEAVFTLYGTRIHLLDENQEYQMLAPKPGEPRPVWLNVCVPDIHSTWKKALKEGCIAVQPVTEMPEMGVANAMFVDPFGYMWMLHQVYREVSFEERCRIFEEQMGAQG